MTREQLNELNALVAENDALTAALANLDAGGLLYNASIGPTAEYAPPVPIMMPPPMMAGMPAMAASVPVRGEVPASLMTELTAYLTARKAAVEGLLATSGATADPASSPQRGAPPPMQRPQQPAAPQQPQRR